MYFSPLFAGALFCNSIPHLTSGLCGLSFPTPFAKPRGAGHSSALTNFLWGLFNVALGLFLFALHPIHKLLLDAPLILLFAGALIMGLYLSTRFAKVQQKKGSV
jgi:FtsH-binding integral membrane protein